MSTRTLAGRRIQITGIVQGVGFRPFVYGLATGYGLHGWVLNDSAGVTIEAIGLPDTLEAFVADLQSKAPPLAVIDSLRVVPLPVDVSDGDLCSPVFRIRHSQAQAKQFVPISPDICICDDCLRELFNPADRRYRYPFINCTNCGPRFTIIRDTPYDRPTTTMAEFPMCEDCRAEYENPLDRRFHAQPNACHRCGPQVTFRRTGDDHTIAAGDEAIRLARATLSAGGIVAVKGLGGFHLACDATNDAALSTLRERKGRVDKPFAVMALDVAAVEHVAHVNEQERTLLTSKARPILLLNKRYGSPLSDLVAPGNRYVGVMLPYTPLHYLLLAPEGFNPTELGGGANRSPILVMTSGNISEEPIVKDDDEALTRLSGLADAFLLHNRKIHVHCDDSVVRVFQGHELPIRRSRGYAPFPVKLPFSAKQVLAVGGELKNTFCLTNDHYAFLGQHIGDMENLETLRAFERSVAHFQSIFRIEPEIVACDMHPGYLSSKWTRGEVGPGGRGSPVQSPNSKVEVQHHHAHIAAVMAEHGLDGRRPVIGFAFDGTGYGPDGAIWGGELLLADYKSFTRLAHLKYVPLPGGDAAIRRPYRVALAHLWAANVPWDEKLPPVAACPPTERGVIRRQLERGLNTVPTSSMGRLFDAVAALAGVRQEITYEAQAAIEFEALAAGGIAEGYLFSLRGGADLHNSETGLQLEVDAGPVVRAVAADVLAGVPTELVSAKFHRGVADLILQLSVWVREQTGLNRVALSGGVFQNVRLLGMAVEMLRRQEFEVLTHWRVPPNDGGLALGQAVVAHCRTQGIGDRGNA